MQDKNLVKLAFKAQAMSYSPYSKFKVGAALLAENGTVYTGCNIESASYSPSNCAERTAFFKAVSEGVTDFEAIAIVGGFNYQEGEYCPPCGVCRQVMVEFCNSNFRIIMAKTEDIWQTHLLGELIPHSFGPGNLK